MRNFQIGVKTLLLVLERFHATSSNQLQEDSIKQYTALNNTQMESILKTSLSNVDQGSAFSTQTNDNKDHSNRVR